jgi:lysophospholipase L1-like esterase
MFPMAEQLMREYPNAQYQTRLKAIADKHHVPYIDLKPRFEQEFTGFGSLFIEWDGHPNPQAYRITAEEISRAMAAMH